MKSVSGKTGGAASERGLGGVSGVFLGRDDARALAGTGNGRDGSRKVRKRDPPAVSGSVSARGLGPRVRGSGRGGGSGRCKIPNVRSRT